MPRRWRPAESWSRCTATRAIRSCCLRPASRRPELLALPPRSVVGPLDDEWRDARAHVTRAGTTRVTPRLQPHLAGDRVVGALHELVLPRRKPQCTTLPLHGERFR